MRFNVLHLNHFYTENIRKSKHSLASSVQFGSLFSGNKSSLKVLMDKGVITLTGSKKGKLQVLP